MSVLLGCGILLASSLVGWNKYVRHLKRERVFSDLTSFLRMCQSEVSNYKTPFEAIAKKYVFGTRELKEALLDKSKESLSRILSADECLLYNDIFSAFSKLNYSELITRLKAIELAFFKSLSVEHDLGAKNGKLALKIGVLIGVGAMILVI